MKKLISFGITVFLVTNFSVSAQGMDFYVDGSVASSGDGQSWAKAWKSFGNINWSLVRSGDTVYISGGSTSKVYTQSLNVGASGTADAPIRITKGTTSGHNGQVIIDGQNSRSYGILIENVNNVVVSELFPRNHTAAGVRVRYSSGGILVDNNDVYTGNGRGLDARANTGTITFRRNRVTTPSNTTAQTDGAYFQDNTGLIIFENNNVEISNTDTTGHSDALQTHQNGSMIVRRNILKSPTAGPDNHVVWMHAILSGHTVQVYNNLMISRGGQSNFTYWRETNSVPNGTLQLWNNTIVGGRGVALERVPSSFVRNNIIWPGTGNTGVAITVTSVPAANFGRNLVWAPNASIGYNPNGLNADPLFVSSSDYSLRPGSPAIDAGMSLSEVTSDIVGVSRPQGAAHDIGAYERLLTPTPSPTPVPTPTPTPVPIQSLYGTAAPAGFNVSSAKATELGVKFRSSVAGKIHGIRFYRTVASSSGYSVNLWSTSGALLATAKTSSDTAGAGWREVKFSSPVAIKANTLYIASYHSPFGSDPYVGQGHASVLTRGPLSAPASSTVGGNGVYRYTQSSAFPNQSWNANQYFVDVLFVAGP